MKINEYITKLIEREGGFSDNPKDKGGPTRFGITEQVARAYGYKGAMPLLPRELAAIIYRSQYWSDPKFDEVNKLSEPLAEKLLDIGVNMGPMIAARFLQRALNTLNRNALSYPDIATDGVLGPMSLTALSDYIKSRGPEGLVILHDMLRAQQRVRYMEISERNPSQEEFAYGWQKRAGEL